MNAPTLRHLLASGLLATALLQAGPASAATPAPAAPSAQHCIALGQDRQIVRAGADRDLLLRDGTSHYRVHFQKRCISAATSHHFTFTTAGQDGQLCGGARSTLRTDTGHCPIAAIEPIDAATFKRLALLKH
ncbi:hypothetical protein [Stenotrophomonas sp. 24(2023)]|uniref:hypothetical protein n=1 Tax=Stenotrophomonas sp. 24(2023) TaxID=3068324 RepID=UPI0027E180DF|nr:hypothetical protein [Stenotrophomonas sp. 24(2023)]WMJ69154.1 hypothetical protein Q9R17_18575 [Stenotrophomonas sp. 24(2023)]